MVAVASDVFSLEFSHNKRHRLLKQHDVSSYQLSRGTVELMQTKTQIISQKAYLSVSNRISEDNPNELTKEYVSFARRFPTLIHSCGLAQAAGFATAKGGHQLQYLDDLIAVLARQLVFLQLTLMKRLLTTYAIRQYPLTSSLAGKLSRRPNG